MAFTGKIGSSDSKPGNVELGLGAVAHPVVAGAVTDAADTLAGTATVSIDPVRQFSQTLPTSCTAGSAVILCFNKVDSGQRILSISDTQGNNWQRAAIYVANGMVLEQWVAFNVVGGAVTITPVSSFGGGQVVTAIEAALTGGGHLGSSSTGTETNTVHSASNLTIPAGGIFVLNSEIDNDATISSYTPGTGYQHFIDSRASGALNVFVQSRYCTGAVTDNGAWTGVGASRQCENLLCTYLNGSGYVFPPLTVAG